MFFFFLASFDSESDSKTFIRGGKKGSDKDGGNGGDVVGGRAGEVYKLDSKGGQGQSRGKGGPLSEMDRMLEELKVSDNK